MHLVLLPCLFILYVFTSFILLQKSIAKETEIEKTTALQIKYSLLLNTEVELVNNLSLFQLLDEWFGTRYRLGGESKTGIDCSAFMQVMYAGLFAIALPRTAREQNRSTRKKYPVQN